MLAFVILIMVNAYILMKTGESPAIQAAPGEKGWTIFGTMGCGWTRKQLEHMKKVKKPFTFVDCDKGGCDAADEEDSVDLGGRRIIKKKNRIQRASLTAHTHSDTAEQSRTQYKDQS